MRPGGIHCAVKGVADVDQAGQIFFMDLFSGRTLQNLKKMPVISVTAIDEDKFIGYSLKGKAVIFSPSEKHRDIINKWENYVIQKISDRIIAGVRLGKKSKEIFETRLLAAAKHIIRMDVEEIIDLSLGKSASKEKA